MLVVVWNPDLLLDPITGSIVMVKILTRIVIIDSASNGPYFRKGAGYRGSSFQDPLFDLVSHESGLE